MDASVEQSVEKIPSYGCMKMLEELQEIAQHLSPFLVMPSPRIQPQMSCNLCNRVDPEKNKAPGNVRTVVPENPVTK